MRKYSMDENKKKLQDRLKKEKLKGKDNNFFTLRIHHGGELLDAPERIYLGSKIDYIDKCDPYEWSLQTLNLFGTTKLGYNNVLDWHFKLPMTDTGMGYIQCLTDADCDLMISTLPANRVADVYITRAGNVQADLDAFEDGGGNNFSKSAVTGINLNDINFKRAEHDGDKNNDIKHELEHFEDDEYHMTESEEEFNCLERDSDSEWLGVWDNSEKDEATVQVIEKKNLKDSAKWRKTEEKNNKAMEESKNTNFAELLLEDSRSKAENGNISSENDESEDMANVNSDDDQSCFESLLRFKNNREISLKKNESGKISAKCSDGCPWHIYASRKAPDDPTIMIKTLVEKHSENCLFVYVNKNVKSRMIAQKYLHHLRKHPDVSIGDFMEKIHEEMNVEISVSQAFRAKRIAKEMIEAIGIDADNGMFPIAYAVVDVEDKHNWKWFLNLLGLEGAIYETIPQVEHRHCVRHLYNNFKKVHKGLSLKTRVWNAARENYVSKYLYEMNMLEKEDEEARNWFNDKPPKFWSKSHFRTTTKSDMLLNNLCESFNELKPILKARRKPILGLLGGIRIYLMRRMNQKRKVVLKYKEEKKEQAATSIPTRAGQLLFQVHTMYGEQFSLDLNGRTCSCRGWDLTGIPFSHAVNCIFHVRGNPENFTNDCYNKATQMRIYEPVIAPMDRPAMWEPTGLLPVEPPNYEPKKDVTKLSKKGRLGRCSKCLQTGHNKTTCKKNSDSQNSTTSFHAPQTSQDWSKNDTDQFFSSKKIHFESTFWVGHTNEPSKLNCQIIQTKLDEIEKAPNKPFGKRGMPVSPKTFQVVAIINTSRDLVNVSQLKLNYSLQTLWFWEALIHSILHILNQPVDIEDNSYKVSVMGDVDFYKEGLTPYTRAKLPITSDVTEGCVIVKEHIPISNVFTFLWFNEVDRFTPRDQNSFAIVRDKIREKTNWTLNMFLDCERRNFVVQGYHRDVLERWPSPPPPGAIAVVHPPPPVIVAAQPNVSTSSFVTSPVKKIPTKRGRERRSKRHRKIIPGSKDSFR
ncbi:hypothetical protein FXO38_20060 [Capsicum annuum]|nr:hypothetical protein FXO38_20060 [Capsicum annuum]